MSAAGQADLKLLENIRTRAADEEFDNDHEICPASTLDIFNRWRLELKAGARPDLSPAMRKWAAGVWARLNGEEAPPEYENLISTGRAPRGREVPTPPVLQNLPKKPPRKAT